VASVAAACPPRGARVLPRSATAASAGQAGVGGGRGCTRKLDRLRPLRQKRGDGPLAPLSPFLNFFSQMFSNSILINLKAFSEFGPRIKVVQNKILYNFALRCNLKF
jgi:hypothetical protein